METENKTIQNMDFLGSPVAKTPRFHCRGQGADPWSGLGGFHMLKGN